MPTTGEISIMGRILGQPDPREYGFSLVRTEVVQDPIQQSTIRHDRWESIRDDPTPMSTFTAVATLYDIEPVGGVFRHTIELTRFESDLEARRRMTMPTGNTPTWPSGRFYPGMVEGMTTTTMFPAITSVGTATVYGYSGHIMVGPQPSIDPTLAEGIEKEALKVLSMEPDDKRGTAEALQVVEQHAFGLATALLRILELQGVRKGLAVDGYQWVPTPFPGRPQPVNPEASLTTADPTPFEREWSGTQECASEQLIQQAEAQREQESPVRARQEYTYVALERESVRTESGSTPYATEDIRSMAQQFRDRFHLFRTTT